MPWSVLPSVVMMLKRMLRQLVSWFDYSLAWAGDEKKNRHSRDFTTTENVMKMCNSFFFAGKGNTII